MADTVREIERKYEVPDGGRLPDLTGAAGVADVVDQGTATLDATYYDTADQRLAAHGVTLRRRTGGGDAGWHLKLPAGPDARDEIRAPLSDTLPAELAALVRSRVRDAALVPLVRLLSERDVRHLVDADGALLAELSADRVTARRLTPEPGEPVRWTEVEVELAPGGDPALLDALESHLTRGGVRRAAAASKLARALAETADPAGAGERAGAKAGAGEGAAAGATAGDTVLAYVRAQLAAVVALDPAVRLEAPDSVHRMRVATRRLRSAFRSFRKVLDRAATDPLADELKWLAGELGIDRDREVLTARLEERLRGLPDELRAGPVAARLGAWARERRGGTRDRLLGVLDGDRYLALLNALDALSAEPPLRPAATRPPEDVLVEAVERDYRRLAALVTTALAAPPGQDRDLAMHEARKGAKRARYAAEAARPALGRPAKAFADLMTGLQELLGDHQDSCVARRALRELAEQAQAAGESAFAFGVMYGREEALAARREAELPALWAEASREKHRGALRRRPGRPASRR
ncbi:CYTH and CHAD domain-containing protein [Streptomyces sparsogenes]|uniref:Putative nucleotide-phosphate cyclase n=1 Tax=Streptomyces sparsogenes DSM 40356 TaxID=1331668 RepID=A0A1R1SJ91_9ACTN|nr:CYTH and CHAD domain-containing protein [Streptomyces sparsogenes]OMI38368.1 putative nucleotide-phosphate cyclase [Streptomyces sparsogenes DSM 40356]